MKFSCEGENKMSEIKNKIITISGEPASGKSTVVRMLKEKYEEKGYTVHIEPIGHYWRDAAVETYKKIKPEIQNPTLDEIHADPEFESFRKEIDIALDTKVRKRGEEINSQIRPNEVFIFDSRLAWQNIPSSYAVRLTVDEKMAGLRVYNDQDRGQEDKYPTEEAAIEATRIRKEEEIKRYINRYQVDLANQENYDLIADTTFSNTEELADIIIDGEKAYREGNDYPKMWASPLTFLSEQREQDTYNNKVKELVDIINENGFEPMNGTVEIAENEGIKILLNGNHRVCARLSTGNTLVPYKVTNKDNGFSQQIANMIYNDPSLNLVYDWAEILSYFGGSIGNLQVEKIRDLKYIEGLKDLEDLRAKHLIAVSKVAKLRKILGLEVTSEQQSEEYR